MPQKEAQIIQKVFKALNKSDVEELFKLMISLCDYMAMELPNPNTLMKASSVHQYRRFMGIQLMLMFSSRKLQSIIRDEKTPDYTV